MQIDIDLKGIRAKKVMPVDSNCRRMLAGLQGE